MGYLMQIEKTNNYTLEFETEFGWCGRIKTGLIWKLFKDERKQLDNGLLKEARVQIKECVKTQMPPFGGWR